MLYRDGRLFCIGMQRYVETIPARTSSPGIVLQVTVGWTPAAQLEAAIFDTGASWTILNRDLARRLDLLDVEGELTLPLSTRLGRFEGHLMRVPFVFPATEGMDLALVAPCLVCPEWYAPTFLGYQGLMDRLRFAVDPADNSFHFGVVG